jgi:hypothetical protein
MIFVKDKSKVKHMETYTPHHLKHFIDPDYLLVIKMFISYILATEYNQV